MENTSILVIGTHPEILQTVLRLINNNPLWKATGTTSPEEAKDIFLKNSFDLVLIGAGIDKDTDEALRTFFRQNNDKIAIAQHYGGGSGLLYTEIAQAIHQK
ncbi:hypothetical protein SAMN04515674_101404 [Pseudarcicella hirudinis]|uniref:Response regulator receiver domain-containing protein n=1 Tax=Pseudarcicella hirudinis TaxID=1079859 RepID=A0A1I5MQL1_9BACT|nr:response regulator receiver protein [Pseudarcicella hirudinis]SFP11803.1 hypothetical protein SAMN04515674_101404 [Pseudarcicella hirudinis]